jgi:hypothetical protein
MDRRRKLSELPASRCQAQKLVQGTSPVEMKMMREEILSAARVRNPPAPHRLRGAKAIPSAMATKPI